MKITGIKTNIFSSRHSNAKRNWLIVRIQTDEGIEGIGESSMLSSDPIVESLIREWSENYLVAKILWQGRYIGHVYIRII